MRVAVEPVSPAQMPQLVEGLRLLNRADPFVEVIVQESGEHVIGAAGRMSFSYPLYPPPVYILPILAPIHSNLPIEIH